ncbi:hypothetical protein CLV24_115105 [Pontibacter ummariensis]|uniref:Uncharacterized protein n=1 Tax=Pontibacter ummariensis TaxID=1610492 RepID=A0A239I349_9BACT|nr:hypothetical protein [Pontibacter ummariensis]PRY10188.1 hypothetical protein CLV24_115105 [Pontibacter ummariensis]SNS87718.1 hypothetical protein SAMN06296052_115105 [Pontibacter ummariensis]
MADQKDKSNELKSHAGEGGNLKDQRQSNTGPQAGSAANTRGENKPHTEGDSAGAKKAKPDLEKDSPQGSHRNSTTTTRGADSTDKEFRNNQPNASTLKGHKSSSGLGNEKQ